MSASSGMAGIIPPAGVGMIRALLRDGEDSTLGGRE